MKFLGKFNAWLGDRYEINNLFFCTIVLHSFLLGFVVAHLLFVLLVL